MITPGALLLEKGTPIPPFFGVRSESHLNAWMSVTTTKNFPHLERELATAGWTFFYIADEMRATAFGFNRQEATDNAIERLMASVRSQHCNGLEIDHVSTHSFLGLPYVSVTAHARHIQQGGWAFHPTRDESATDRGA